jgi:hypothetical protein
MIPPRSGFADAPSGFALSPQGGASPDEEQSLRTVPRLRAPLGLPAKWHRQWPGRAGTTAVACLRQIHAHGVPLGAMDN